MDTQKLETTIADLNALISQFVPLVGGGILAVKMLVALFRHNGVDIGPFEAEVAKLLAAEDAAQALIDAFRAKHGPEVPPETLATGPEMG